MFGKKPNELNSIQEETESRLKPWNACYLSSPNLLPKNMKTKINRNIILPVVFMGLILGRLREESKLRVSVNRVLRRLFGARRDEITGEWRKLHNDELINL